jgi:beta-lactamase class A
MLLDRLGLDAVAAVTPPGITVRRPIGDTAAAKAGITNTVTAAATAELLTRLATGSAAGEAACREMLAVLADQQYRAEIPAGLPPGTAVGTRPAGPTPCATMPHSSSRPTPPPTPWWCARPGCPISALAR